jgi:hypothetical protein
MEELLKKIMETELLDDASKKAIAEGFQKKLDEARSDIEAKVRKELAERNAADRDRLIEACERMIKDGLERELKELVVEHAQAKRMSARAAKAIAEADRRADRKTQARLAVVEKWLRDQLVAEMRELHADQKLNRKATLAAINETREQSERARRAFIRNGAKVLENLVEKQLKGKLKELHEDIREAKKNDFGRRVFEAFMVEMRRSFFNENDEAKKLASKLAEAEQKLNEQNALLEAERKSKDSVIAKEREQRRKLEESVRRGKTMSALLSRLTGQARTEMKALLEAAPTDRLEATFKKFLPSVTTAKGPAKKPLTEGKISGAPKQLRTGDKVTEARAGSQDSVDDEIRRMAKNAGLRVVK